MTRLPLVFLVSSVGLVANDVKPKKERRPLSFVIGKIRVIVENIQRRVKKISKLTKLR